MTINEENACVQKESSAQTAKAETKEGATELGKFKDVSALAEAYRALQAEFTRRSQRLRALEKEAENSARESDVCEETESEKQQAESVSTQTATENVSVSTNEREPAEAFIQKKARSDEELLDEVMKNDEVRLKVIGEYLSSLKRDGVPIVTKGAASPAVSYQKAKSVADAGKMALRMFKNGHGA